MKAYRFGSFELVPESRSLSEGDKRIPLGGRAFDVLVVLLERAGQVVSKEELLAEVWGRTSVDSTSLRVHIAALRKALRATGDSYIASVLGRGYCFVAPVTQHEERGAVDEERRSTPHAASQLPSLLTRVIGRDDVVVALKQQLLAKRFVTIVGPAGIGKSTVALSVAAQLGAEFRDGCHFIDFLSLHDAKFVPNAIALPLQAPLSQEDAGASLVQALRHKQLLLVLDNCEHLIDAIAAFVEALLQGAASVALLVTSREPLRAQGEWVSRLPILEYPDGSSELTAAQALEYPAVELFVERASAVSDGFSLSDADAPLVSELCSRLDGIPLAIELAAARADAFSVKELATRFDDRFRLLMRGRRTALARHQTLRGALDWSYELLPFSQQLLLRRLGVFAASFVLDDAVSVATGNGLTSEQVMEELSELVVKSLVRLDVSTEQARYRLLATTRAYAVEKLQEARELGPARRRQAEWICALIEHVVAEAKRRGVAPQLQPGLVDDLRAALQWAYEEGGDLTVAVTLTAAAAPLIASFSLHSELGKYLARAFDVARALQPPDLVLEMRVGFALGGLWLHMKRDADELFSRCTELADRLGDRVYQTHTAEAMWASSFGRAEYPTCVTLAQRYASAITDSPAEVANAARLSGIAAHFMGDLRAASEHLELAFQSSAARVEWDAVNPVQVPRQFSAGISLSRNLWLAGDYARAMELVQELLTRAASLDHRLTTCYVLGFAACPFALWRGDRIDARRLVSLLTSEATRSGFALWQQWARCLEVVLSPRATLPEDVNHMQQELLATCREDFASEALLARFEAGLAGWCGPELLRISAERSLKGHSTSDAEATLQRALELARTQGAAFWELRCASSLSRIWCDTGRGAAARALLEPVVSQAQGSVSSLDLETAKSLLRELT